LRLWTYKQKQSSEDKDVAAVDMLERCRDAGGNLAAEPTAYQMKIGINVGNPVVLTCFICRRYLDENGHPYYRKTSFWCKTCHMPICMLSRKGKEGGRELSCIDEHVSTEEPVLRCSNSLYVRGTNVPDNICICLHARRSKRKKN
jgi:hypothetical protein